MHWILVIWIGFAPANYNGTIIAHPTGPRTPVIYSAPAVAIPTGWSTESTTTISIYPGGATKVETWPGKPSAEYLRPVDAASVCPRNASTKETAGNQATAH